MTRAIFFALSALHLFTLPSAHADTQRFFKQHCIKCHGPDKQKAKLRLDTLAWKPSDTKNVELWQQILDRSDSEHLELCPHGLLEQVLAVRHAA